MKPLNKLRSKHFCRWFTLILMLCYFTPFQANAQSTIQSAKEKSNSNSNIRVGIRLQKSIGFYFVNGVVGEYTFPNFLKSTLSFQASWVSSRLGSAIGTNAIPYSEWKGGIKKQFGTKSALQFFAQINAGYAHSNYGSDIFSSIPNNMMLLSVEPGISYDLRIPLRFSLGGGYNFLTGNGVKGLGTIYPLFVSANIFYTIQCKNRNTQ